MNIKNAFAWQNRARLQLTRPRIGVTSPVFLRAANRMCQSSTLGTRTPTILNEDIDATRHQNFAPVYHGSGNNGDIIDKGSNSMKQLNEATHLRGVFGVIATCVPSPLLQLTTDASALLFPTVGGVTRMRIRHSTVDFRYNSGLVES